jgi:hypothetical protein
MLFSIFFHNSIHIALAVATCTHTTMFRKERPPSINKSNQGEEKQPHTQGVRRDTGLLTHLYTSSKGRARPLLPPGQLQFSVLQIQCARLVPAITHVQAQNQEIFSIQPVAIQWNLILLVFPQLTLHVGSNNTPHSQSQVDQAETCHPPLHQTERNLQAQVLKGSLVSILNLQCVVLC